MMAAAIVTAVFTTFYLLRGIGIFEDVVDSAMDQRMILHADVDYSVRPLPALIDFDDRTMAALGDPIVVPPQKIAAVLHALPTFRPRAVFLDLDVSYLRPGPDLQAVTAGLHTLADGGVPILLARDVLPGPSQDRLGRLRPTPLDTLVAHHPNLMWVSTKFSTSDDGLVRHMPVLGSALLDGCPVSMPSSGLAFLLLDRTGSLAAAKRALALALRDQARCGRAQPPTRLELPTARGDIAIDMNNQTRIDYRMRWQDAAQATSIPALPLTDPQGRINAEDLIGRIFIIGSTAGFRDYAQTPLKRMPGAWIHANAIQAWLESGPDPGVRFWKGAAFVIPFTVAVSLGMVGLILSLPQRHRPTARALAPLAITTLFWLVFQWLGAPSMSIGLFVVAYGVAALIAMAEKRFESHLDVATA